MALRIAAILLAVVYSVSFCRAGEADGEILAGHPAETNAGSETPVVIPFGQSDDVGGHGIIVSDVRLRGNGATKRDVNSDAGRMTDKVNSVFRDQSREFPFPPRMIRQSNYDIQITDESLLSDEFRMMQERNAAQRLLLFSGPGAPSSASDAQNTIHKAALGVDFILTAGEGGVLGLQPVIVAAGQCESACTAAACSDEQPIDVVLASDEECDSVSGAEAFSAQCASSDATSRVHGGAALGLVPPPPAPAELLQTLPRIMPRPPTVHLQELSRLDSGFSTFTLAGDTAGARGKATAASSSASPEACTHAEPPLKVKVDHLLEAARHLAGAGYEEEAKLFRVEAEAIQRASTRLLAEKRQELERLQREVAELELLTGQYDLIQLDFSILEFSVPSDCDTQACRILHEPGLHVLTSSGRSITSSSSVVYATDLVQFLSALEQCACDKPTKIWAPKIITTNGRTAAISNGGSLVLPVSSDVRGGAKAGAPHENLRYGIELQALPVVLGDDKIRLNLVAEVSEPDFSNAVNLNGTTVPGLNSRRCNTTVETRFGDVVAISFNPAKNSTGERKSMLVLVTPLRVSSLDGGPAKE